MVKNVISLSCSSAEQMTRLRNTLLVFSGEINNGIKKEPLAKDTPRLWINEGIKMQTFSHSLVNASLI